MKLWIHGAAGGRRTISWLLWSSLTAALAVVCVACQDSPRHGDVYANKSTPLYFLGASPLLSSSELAIGAYNYAGPRWDDYLPLESSDYNIRQLGYPVDWYLYSAYPVTLEPASWYWLPQVLANGAVSSTKAKARVRVTDPENGSYIVLEEGYSGCAAGKASLTEVGQVCGDPGAQAFAEIYTTGYTEADYENITVRVLNATGETINTNELLHAASVVIQRKETFTDPSTPSDYACRATWVRSGPTSAIVDPDGDGRVGNEAEWDWYVAKGIEKQGTASRVLILTNRIDYCGGSGLFEGCADPTNNVAMISWYRGFGGQLQPRPVEEFGPLIAHELLHTHQGGWDHAPYADDPTNIMSLASLISARRLSAANCDFIRNAP